MEEMTMWTAEEAFLKHHGILGQKWGQRNGPPYPLGESDHSAAEKKAEKEHKGLTDKQKKAIKIGAIAVGSTLAVAGGIILVKSGKLDKVMHLGKNELSRQGIVKLDLQKFAKSKHKPFNFKNEKEYAIVTNAFSKHQLKPDDLKKPSLIKSVNIDDQGAYDYLGINDGNGNFEIVSRVRKVKDSSTGLLERMAYVKDK